MTLIRIDRQLLLQAAAAVGVANAAFWWLGHSLNLDRAAFNLDVVLALAVMAVLPRLGLALSVLAWLCDWLVSQSQIFHFADPGSSCVRPDSLRPSMYAVTSQPTPSFCWCHSLFASV